MLERASPARRSSRAFPCWFMVYKDRLVDWNAPPSTVTPSAVGYNVMRSMRGWMIDGRCLFGSPARSDID
jgi:hypothetical protein